VSEIWQTSAVRIDRPDKYDRPQAGHNILINDDRI
jgi:hypothetical protein